MARRPRSVQSTRLVERDLLRIATTFRVLRPIAVRAPTISDRRTFDPTRAVRSAFVSRGPRQSSRVVASRYPSRGIPSGLGFLDPRRVDLCRRREERRRVLLASGAAGGRAPKRKRFNAWSKVRC